MQTEQALASSTKIHKTFHLMLRTTLSAISLLLPLSANADSVWQPIIDYSISFPGDKSEAAPLIKPFENFTHFASDFGWVGAGGNRIEARGGVIHVKPDGQSIGAWHSLAGLATQSSRLLNPADLTGLGGPKEKRAGIRKLSINASGHGSLRLELADVNRAVIWSGTVKLASDSTTNNLLDINPAASRGLKFMNWIAEPGSGLQVSSIGFIAERPEMPIEEWMFRISLGKLRRCHDAASGFTRDRGHLPAAAFDSISSTGMQALSSALGAAEGILTKDKVSAEITTTIAAFRSLPRAAGFFPHFVARDDSGKITIHPGTEFSTIDTAIALQSLLLATDILAMSAAREEVVAMISAIDFDAVTDADGWINHGFQDDGKTPLTKSWRDWGGETALILALEAMIPDRIPRGKMSDSGEIYGGVGFIAEIQSLFYPDFDKTEPDLISGISWPEARQEVLAQQQGYVITTWPDSRAARDGIFGLSAGEAGLPGAGYTANGTNVMGIRWFHPHYMIMGLALSRPEKYAEGLRHLDAAAYLQPLGLPENIEVELRLHNPMQSSLNAAFETLAAYHGWRKRGSAENFLDRASMKNPLTRHAASRFYPLH